ncbi:MAG: glycerol kinase GlpK [Armatimonadetes bacterium]|nr:glycerol kinase GlpK [Armatimonadota bacterium]
MSYIIAIDQGTTGTKVCAYDAEGNAAASAYREFTQHFPQPGYVEHDPEEIWQSVIAPLESVLRQLPDCSIAGIGITNQRETTVVWDKNTGRPIHNAIVWQCRRTARRCDEIPQDKRDRIRSLTGLPVDAYFSATNIEWILRNVPSAMDSAERGELAFVTIDSWLLWKLTGGRVHATDPTNASRTMLFDIDRREWASELLEIFNIPAKMLPDVMRSSGVFGSTDSIGSLPSGVPICGIAGDQQAALFGQACCAAGAMKCTYGTGSFLLLNVGDTRPHSDHGLIVTIACGEDGRPVYALEGSVFVAGAAIQWLRDGLKILSSAAESEDMALSVPDTGGVYFVPALTGLGAPYWDQEARGSIYGLTRSTDSRHIVRAALEAMCYQTKDVLDAMAKDSGLEVNELRIDGGASANEFVCRFQADILGIDVLRPSIIETTSLGAACLAGLAIGFWNPDDIARRRSGDRVFSPQMPPDQADRLYRGWQDAVRRTLSSKAHPH